MTWPYEREIMLDVARRVSQKLRARAQNPDHCWAFKRDALEEADAAEAKLDQMTATELSEWIAGCDKRFATHIGVNP